MQIREAVAADHETIWRLFQEVAAAGDAFSYDEATSREEALQLWTGKGARAYMAEQDGEAVATYYLRPNQPGRGSHVANAGFMVSTRARGRGIGRALGEHALAEAARLGYQAMQFNFVVSTNTSAVALWRKLGFAIVGTVPAAFRHHQLGPVDVHVMHRAL